MKNMKKLLSISVPMVVLGLASISTAQVGVDGVRGSEWSGVTPTTVLYDSSAPTGNFGAPTNVSNTVAYDIYLRSDSNYVYGLLEAKPAGQGNDAYDAGLLFANLYFSTNPFGLGGTGSGSIGFELLNDRSFKPGGSGYLPGTLTSLGFVSATTAGSNYPTGGADIIEFAAPWTYFETDPQSAPFVPMTQTNNKLRLNLSQTFGYSVAGGVSAYGSNELGVLTLPSAVPEPASILAIGLGAMGLFLRKRK